MKILSPINKPSEVAPLADAGADEFYAGVLDTAWRRNYGNVGSPNRREWSVSNLCTFEELEEAVNAAHSLGKRLFLTMNALYTAPQYPLLKKELERIREIPVDALIVADPGLMLLLRKEMKWDVELHLSTGATAFNHGTARFYYQNFNTKRMVIPRQHNLEEIARLAKSIDFLDLECFIFNSGCKNIDGFCTYHHGVNEILHGGSYSLPKKLGLDYLFLKILRNLPQKTASSLCRACNIKSDSACLLNWDVDAVSQWSDERKQKAVEWLESTFNIWSGLDPCGGCAIPALEEAGIKSLKIVGRENPTYKKIMDVKFLRRMLDFWTNSKHCSQEDYRAEAMKAYKEIFGAPCRQWCYYP